jgi:hypothetical protein
MLLTCLYRRLLIIWSFGSVQHQVRCLPPKLPKILYPTLSVDSTRENAALFHLATGNEVLTAFERSQDAWRFEWDPNESLFVRSPQANQLELFKPDKPNRKFI